MWSSYWNWEVGLLRAGARLCPHAAYISSLCFWTWCLPCSCIFNSPPPWPLTNSSSSLTSSCHLCWTLWSTRWGTVRWKMPWGRSSGSRGAQGEKWSYKAFHEPGLGRLPVFVASKTVFFFFSKFYFVFKLYNIVLVLPNIEMNPPQVYMCSPSWTLLPPPSPYHPSGSSQCTSPKHPVLCIEPGLATRFIYDIMHI